MATRSESPKVCDPPISDLVEKVLGLLEEAGIDTATNDKIAKLIEQAELRVMAAQTFSAVEIPNSDGVFPWVMIDKRSDQFVRSALDGGIERFDSREAAEAAGPRLLAG